MLTPTLRAWLDNNALLLDQTSDLTSELFQQLATSDLFRIGVPSELGGLGGSILDAINALSQVATHSLTAAFMFWGHRTYIEILLQASSEQLIKEELVLLLSGQLAGATGLSNAMKFLSGIEELQVKGCKHGDSWHISGKLHWVTNLQHSGFRIVTVIEPDDGSEPFIASIASNQAGVTLSPELSLMGMQGSATAAIVFDDVKLRDVQVIHPSARQYLPLLRPHFLGLQCGMALGMVARTLNESKIKLNNVLHSQWEEANSEFRQVNRSLLEGIGSGQFIQQPEKLFRLRLALINLAQRCMQLELMQAGGKAYLSPHGDQIARRWRECAFLPLVTPSVTQLTQQLSRRKK
ncbi:acyl-CoA dehydrogenase family protein [Pantoea sp. App145]|uniref:acyl-CoA dehydrogenase family protein n=1 Tax=Pantoea sp. App145 TaxID=3071567 RepID=UPI003A812472